MTTDAGHEAPVEQTLVLEVLQHLVSHKRYPRIEELKERSPGRAAVIDSLVEKGFLGRVGTRQGVRVELTPAGLLKYGSGEGKTQAEQFIRLLPALETACRKDRKKEWSAEELGALAGVPPFEVSLALTLFGPALPIADTFTGVENADWVVALAFDKSFEPAKVTKHLLQLGEEEGIGLVARMSHLKVSGYRALDRFSAQFGPITVIIGANATGKSSLFDLLALVSFAGVNPLPPEIDPRSFGRALFHLGGPEIIELELRVTRGDFRPLKYSVKISGPVGKPQITSEKLVSVSRELSEGEVEAFTFLEFEKGEGRVFKVSQVRDDPNYSETWTIAPNELALRRSLDPRLITPGEFRDYVVNWKFYSGFGVRNDAGIRRPVLTEPEPILKEDGSNLGAVLFHLMTEHRERWEELETHLRSAIPAFQSLSVKSRGGPGTVMVFWREAGVKGELTLAELSEGTIAFLCWATLCLSPRKPPLLCIDEPEIGLHPRVLPVLAGLLRQAATESQLLVATHSPYLLSQFALDEIAVMKKVEGRAVFCRPASDEALRREIDELGSGELVRLHLGDGFEARS
jgi:predicted ATPase